MSNTALQPNAHESLWHLSKGDAVAEVTIDLTQHGPQLQLRIDQDVVFACLFQMDGEKELAALAHTMRGEFLSQGWSLRGPLTS
jgi:hypothetical protein